MAQQTAVNFLINYMCANFHLTDESLQKFEQAKAMEKEQIAKAWDAGYFGYFSLGIREIEFNNGEEYYDINYNETYKK